MFAHFEKHHLRVEKLPVLYSFYLFRTSWCPKQLLKQLPKTFTKCKALQRVCVRCVNQITMQFLHVSASMWPLNSLQAILRLLLNKQINQIFIDIFHTVLCYILTCLHLTLVLFVLQVFRSGTRSAGDLSSTCTGWHCTVL